MLLELPNVTSVRPGEGGVTFDFEGEKEALAQVLQVLVERGLNPIEFAPVNADLEDVFLSLTEGILQ